MSYNKTAWENLPSTNTPLSANNFNKIENELELLGGKSITISNEDLDDYTKEGIYYFSNSYTPANIPAGVNGWLLVFATENYIKQIWFRHGTSNINDFETYIRTTHGNIWSDWKKFAIEDNQETTLTLENYFDTIDINKVIKTGNVVQVIFRGHTNQDIANDTIIATLPFTPKNGCIIPVSTTGRYAIGDFQFSYTSSQSWKIGLVSNNKWIQADFTYICV